MAYFIPSSIQKRLLRYALSRLEFLDTDALDLDKLEIGWGRKSTVELKDVALRKAKLSALLRLPSRLSIEEAKVALLRVTVPADLHTASITVEIEGVEARAKLRDNEGSDGTAGETSIIEGHRPSINADSKRAGSPPLPRRLSEDKVGFENDDESDVIPTTRDLAASFLAEEPKAEKEQLQAAILSQSTDLRQSVASVDSGDDAPAYGTGVGLSLPAFLADFLKGIIDRLRVNIMDISVKLDINLDSSPDEITRLPEIETTSETTVELSVQSVEVFQIGDYPMHAKSTNEVAPDSTLDDTGDATQHRIRTGERRVILKGVSGSLISDAATFAHLSQVFDRAGVASESFKDTTNNTDDAVSSSEASSHPYSSQDTVHDDKPDAISPESSSIIQARVENQKGIQDSESELVDAQLFATSARTLPISKPRTQEDVKQSAVFEKSGSPELPHVETDISSQLGVSQGSIYDHDALRRFRDRRASPSGRIAQSVPMPPGQPKETDDTSKFDFKSPSSSMPGTFEPEVTIRSQSIWPEDAEGFFDNTQHGTMHNSIMSSNDDLMESRVFSHVEAESIYMSALHDVGNEGDDDVDMPGTWKQESGVFSEADLPFHFKSSDASMTSEADQEPQGTATSAPTIDVSRRTVKSDNIAQFRPSSETSASNPDKASPTSSPSSPSENLALRPLFHIDSCEIWLPQSDSQSTTHAAQSQIRGSPSLLTQSEYRTVPGAFSMYAESHGSTMRGSRRFEETDASSRTYDAGATFETSLERRNTFVEMSLASLKARVDAFTGKLLVQLIRKVQSIVPTNVPTTLEGKQGTKSKQKLVSNTRFEIFLQHLEITVLEAVADRTFDPSSAAPGLSMFVESASEKALFRLTLRELSIDTGDIASTAPVTIDVGQFKFGFADESIISFSQEMKLRASLRDGREVVGKDFTIEIGRVNGAREIHVATQPIKIAVNLQRIDNTLGSVGGLSSLLELGSSILSDSTIVNSPPKQHPRSRTVRFDSSAKPASERVAQDSQARMNLRIGGTYISLKGAKSRFNCQSTSIKVVARNALIGVQIGDLKLEGPRVRSGIEHAPILVRLRDISFKYLFTPEEHDLTRLISLLTPSKDKFEDDDDFLVDTLVRQRKKGAVLRLNLSKLDVDCISLHAFDSVKELGGEISKMSAVTKLLPKDTRPGLLTLSLVENVSVRVQTGRKVAEISAELGSLEVAQVTAPSLIALAIGRVVVGSENNGEIVRPVVAEDCKAQQPMLMARMIEDEIEPSIKVKLWNTCFEYSVPLLVATMDRDEGIATGQEVTADLANSIANLAERPKIQKSNTQSSFESDNSKSEAKPTKIDVAFRDCAVGLTPLIMPSKALFVLTDARVYTGLPDSEGFKLRIEFRKATALLTNNREQLIVPSDTTLEQNEAVRLSHASQIDKLCLQGFVSVTSISTASVAVAIADGPAEGIALVDVELRNKLFVLETCADSTQTLIETLGGLLPPTPPSQGQKYRTEVAPMEDMMASFTGDAFAIPRQDASSYLGGNVDDDAFECSLPEDFENVGEFAPDDEEFLSEVDEMLAEDFATSPAGAEDPADPHMEIIRMKGAEQEKVFGTFTPGRMPPQVQGTANKWDSAKNRYIQVKKSELSSCPLKLRVRDTYIIWNLYDGYDWVQTRDTITKAVQDVEKRATERRQRNATDEEEDEESVIGDFLFNSIYIGIPVSHDPRDLSRQINRNIDELVSETASQAPSHTSTAASRPTSSHRTKSHGRKLQLNRSRRHKIAFELRGVYLDFFAFPPGGETQSSVDVRVDDFEIFDHVPTSTWKKFATYLHDAGPREDNKPMLHLEICDVRPVPELTAAELVIRATVLPLRLHVDQDALDFITRFFEFSDSNRPHGGSPTEEPYLQRVEVRQVPVKLDYKPKKIDYAGLRSGRSTEFMNFFILDGAEFVLKHVVVYGTSGFAKLHRSLEDVWMPDVKMNQLPSVLSGLNGVRTLVNVGTGLRDLVAIPIQEYQKDGRIVRSISKGALAFARTTGSELTRFGAKVAVGAQTALQGAEGLLAHHPQPHDAGWEEMDVDPEEKRAISQYANQPTGILQGLKGAARSLERDLLATRDVIVAISGEVRESNTAEGAALAVARGAPTLILRPMIGATKAISQTLMGATNTVDPQNRRRMEDKYKRY